MMHDDMALVYALNDEAARIAQIASLQLQAIAAGLARGEPRSETVKALRQFEHSLRNQLTGLPRLAWPHPTKE
jgi:hypothetical protein